MFIYIKCCIFKSIPLLNFKIILQFKFNVHLLLLFYLLKFVTYFDRFGVLFLVTLFFLFNLTKYLSIDTFKENKYKKPPIYLKVVFKSGRVHWSSINLTRLTNKRNVNKLLGHISMWLIRWLQYTSNTYSNIHQPMYTHFVKSFGNVVIYLPSISVYFSTEYQLSEISRRECCAPRN